MVFRGQEGTIRPGLGWDAAEKDGAFCRSKKPLQRLLCNAHDGDLEIAAGGYCLNSFRLGLDSEPRMEYDFLRGRCNSGKRWTPFLLCGRTSLKPGFPGKAHSRKAFAALSQRAAGNAGFGTDFHGVSRLAPGRCVLRGYSLRDPATLWGTRGLQFENRKPKTGTGTGNGSAAPRRRPRSPAGGMAARLRGTGNAARAMTSGKDARHGGCRPPQVSDAISQEVRTAADPRRGRPAL